MTPAIAKDEIHSRLKDMESFIEEYFKKGETDLDTWLSSYDAEIEQLLRGLKRICFDCGEVTKYPVYRTGIVMQWKIIRKRIIGESKC